MTIATLSTLSTILLLWFGLNANISQGQSILLIVLGWVFSFISILSFGLWIMSQLSLRIITTLFRLFENNILPKFLQGKLAYFEHLKFSLLNRLVKERLSSGVKMINEVFLKQIRRLNYNLFYSKEVLKHRRITSLIYELTREEFLRSESDEISDNMAKPGRTTISPPSDKILDSAQIATNTGSTLWFDDEDRKIDRLNNLVACGQSTTCYNLLIYLLGLPEQYKTPEIKELTEVLQKDWERFNEDPFWLV